MRLRESGEDYLEAILMLQQERGAVRAIDIAERLGVSRQTVSNWENSRSFPDIGSVVKMSDLYSVSLDKLLKGDEAMMRHLEMSTNVVKSRQRFSRMILVLVYLLIWTVTIVSFWWTSGSDAMGYGLLAFYIVLPLATLVISVFIGKDESWSGSRWLMMLSAESKKGSHHVGGTPVDVHSMMPPTESCERRASSTILGKSSGLLQASISTRRLSILIFLSNIFLATTPAATRARVRRPEKCPPPR